MEKQNGNGQNKLLLPILAAVIVITAISLLFLPIGKQQKDISGTEEADSLPSQVSQETGNSPVIFDGNEAEVLSIPKSEITQSASFYPVIVDGTEMEVLAIRTAGGEIRTAMNTCQSCYPSGRGYYKADGTQLVCQNCGFRFTAEAVGLEGHGGCNPWPVPSGKRLDTEDEIQIPYATLLSAKNVFANWKS